MANPILPAALSMHGKRVLVTGAASGIGRATAKVLAEVTSVNVVENLV